ncbi:hypothetical protein EJ110_NYTH10027 [Nymphaea thermarum]|nr:hypothetical protein EJ110_NYTH10027 [Nymphaea thermarum]
MARLDHLEDRRTKKRHMYMMEERWIENQNICASMVASVDAPQAMLTVEVPRLGKEAAAHIPGVQACRSKPLGPMGHVVPTGLLCWGRSIAHSQGHNKAARVLVICCEINASIFYGPVTLTRVDNLVGPALFADGAAAVIMSADPLPDIIKPIFHLTLAQQTILPDSDTKAEWADNFSLRKVDIAID